MPDLKTPHHQHFQPPAGAAHAPPATHGAPTHPPILAPHPHSEKDDDEKKASAPKGPSWLSRHAELAPWAQALGVILAVIIAFVIGSFNEWSERDRVAEERSAQGEILAYAVRYELTELKASFDQLSEAHQALTTAPDRLLGLTLYVPPELLANRDRLYLLGHAEGLSVQKALSDARRVAFLLDFIRKDARSYAEYYAKQGTDNSGAGTALYFNAKQFEDAIFALSSSLSNAMKMMRVSERDRM